MQSFKKLNCCLVLILLVLNAACSKTKSENVKTSGVYASYTVQGNSAGAADCTVSFQVGGSTGTFLELTGGDNVTCNGQSMSKTEILGVVQYVASVNYSPGSNYTVTFTRPGEAPYTSTVSLPDPVAPQSPTSNSSVKKGTVLPVSWLKSNTAVDGMTVQLSYSVTTNGVTQSQSYYKYNGPAETGSTAFTAVDTSPFVSPGTWAGKVRFSRSRSGNMPGGLDGVIRAAQTTEVPVQLID